MNRREFFKELREALEGQVPPSEIEGSVAYYENYIREQKEQGLEEDEIFQALGNPRLIARSIIDAKGSENLYYHNEDDIFEEEKQDRDPHVFVFDMDSAVSKAGCLIGALIVAFVGITLFAAVFRYIGPILLIAALIYIVKDLFR